MWSVARKSDRFEIALRDEPLEHAPLLPALNQRASLAVDAVVAALWRLCVELPDGTKTCTSCPPTRGPMLFETRDDARTWCRQNRRKVDWLFQVKIQEVEGGGWGLWLARAEEWARWDYAPHRTCKVCGDTRIVPRPVGDILIGAVPRLVEHWYSTPDQRAFSHRDDGDPGDRENLAVLADGLMQDGDPLGEWLGLWLGGVKCRQCRGRRVIDVPDATASAADYTTSDDLGDDIENQTISCPHCNGWGVELFAHEQAIAERLDALTWIRDRLPEVGDEIDYITGPGHCLSCRVRGVRDGQIEVAAGLWQAFDLADGWRYRVHNPWIQDRLPAIGQRVELRDAIVFPTMRVSNATGEVVSITDQAVTVRVGAGNAAARRDTLAWRPVQSGH